MTHFADEARSRTAQLLRMARCADDRTRQQIIEYAESTPAPVVGPHGISTRGCPRCRRTMWQQQDRMGLMWVCGSCGHVLEERQMPADGPDPEVLRMLDEAIEWREAMRRTPEWHAENRLFAEAYERHECARSSCLARRPGEGGKRTVGPNPRPW